MASISASNSSKRPFCSPKSPILTSNNPILDTDRTHLKRHSMIPTTTTNQFHRCNTPNSNFTAIYVTLLTAIYVLSFATGNLAVVRHNLMALHLQALKAVIIYLIKTVHTDILQIRSTPTAHLVPDDSIFRSLLCYGCSRSQIHACLLYQI